MGQAEQILAEVALLIPGNCSTNTRYEKVLLESCSSGAAL